MSNIAQRSFGGGEVAPGFYARTDLLKYRTGARTLRNFMVQKEGGVANRPGTDWIAEEKDSDNANRMLEFVVSDSIAAVIELGNGYMRFFVDGEPILVIPDGAWANPIEYVVSDIVSSGGDNYYCKFAHTSAPGDEPGVGANWQTYWHPLTDSILEIPTPYVTGDLFQIGYVQTTSTMILVHNGYATRKLVRTSAQRWALSTVMFGPTLAGPSNLAAIGIGAAATIYYAVTSIHKDTGEESLATIIEHDHEPSVPDPNTLTWDPVTDAISYNVYRSTDGVTYGLIEAAGGLPQLQTDSTWSDTSETATSSDPLSWTVAPGAVTNPVTVSATARAYDRIYNIHFVWYLSGDFGALGDISGRYRIYYQRNTDISPVLATTSTLFIQDGEGSQSGDLTDSITVPDDGYTSLTLTIVPEVLGPQLGGTGHFQITTVSIGDVVTWYGQVAGFLDAGAAPDFAVAPPADAGLFVAADDYPATAAFYQQRLFLGSTVREPERVWGSQIGSFFNFNISTPLQDTDAVSFAMVGPKINEVRHLVDAGKMIVMMASGESKLDGDGSPAGIILPDAINPTQLSENGSRTQPKPEKISDSVVYLQARGNIVRSLRPVGAGGSIGGYEGTDLSIFASHLFKRLSIVDWAFAKSPNSILWVVRSDGTMVGLTYLPEFGIWAWHRHDTDGEIESVASIPEGTEDRVYISVKRTINGVTKRYVERMAPRYFDTIADAHFIDCAVRFDGTGTGIATISGGATWESDELLTVTASISSFVAADVTGNAVDFLDADGELLLRLNITEYVSGTVIRGFPDRTVPVELQAVASTTWGIARRTLDGLDHLEGKTVSVFADSVVAASPNNTDSTYEDIEVVGGQIILDAPYLKLLVGLPFISDLQTLDLDSAEGPSVKTRKQLVNQVGLYVEESRGIWAGQSLPDEDDDPLEGMQEYKARESEEWADPSDLITDSIEIDIESKWNNNGRVCIRQVDPLPLTILSVTPTGYI